MTDNVADRIRRSLFPQCGDAPTYQAKDPRYTTEVTHQAYVSLWFRCADPRAIVICFHGNAEDAGAYIPFAVDLSATWRVTVIVPEIPGYGIAPRQNTTEEDCRLCALSIARHAARTGLPVVLLGVSIGTGMAAYAAAELGRLQKPARLLALLAPFESLPQIASEHSPIARMFIKDGFPTCDNVKASGAPTVCIHGAADRMVPSSHSIRIGEATGAQVVLLPGRNHSLNLRDDAVPVLHRTLVAILGEPVPHRATDRNPD